MKRFLYLLLLLALSANAQPGSFLIASGSSVTPSSSNIGSGNAITFTNPKPNHKVWRADSTYTGVLVVPAGCTALTWQWLEHGTQSVVASGTTLTVTHSFPWTSGRNVYDLKVSVTKPGYTIPPRIFPAEVRVLPQVAGEAFADIVYDLSGAGNGFKDGGWSSGTDRAAISTYNSGTTYASGNNVKYSGKYYKSKVGSNTNHQPDISPTQWLPIGSFVVWVKGSGTSFGPFYWYSSDDLFPIQFVFNNASVTTTTATRMFSPGSMQNVIFDGCRNDGAYGFVLTRSSNFSEGIYFTTADNTNPSLTSRRITFGGLYVENTNSTIGGSGFVLTATADATNNYNTYTFQEATIFRIKIRNTRDEGFYVWHFDDSPHPTYTFSPGQYCWFFDNDVLHTGNENFQIGSCFNCEVFKNSFQDAGTRNQSLHRNNIQWSQGNRDMAFYMNYMDGSKNAWQAFTGVGGHDMEFFSNVLYSTGPVAATDVPGDLGVNMLVRLEQNSYFSSMYWGIFNNTLIFAGGGVPNNFYLDVGSPTTTFNKYAYADNLIVTNTATTKSLNNGFSSSMIIEDNYQVTSSATPGFVDYSSKNFHLNSLSSPAFQSKNTTFTRVHWMTNFDYDGYQWNLDTVGAFSGWELQTGN